MNLGEETEQQVAMLKKDVFLLFYAIVLMFYCFDSSRIY